VIELIPIPECVAIGTGDVIVFRPSCKAFDKRAGHTPGCPLAVTLKRGLFTAVVNWLHQRPQVSVLTAAWLAASVVAAYLDKTALYRGLAGFVVDPLLAAVLLVETLLGAQLTAIAVVSTVAMASVSYDAMGRPAAAERAVLAVTASHRDVLGAESSAS
jgi:hypothetical protein